MNSYEGNGDAMKHLIPLYINGQLTDVQKKEFEEALAGSAELKKELEAWEELGKTYERIAKELPQPSKYAYARIAAQKADKIEQPRRVSFFERFMPSPSFSFVVVAAQLLIIIALGAYIAAQRSEFRTLSAPSIAAGQPIKVNVVFNNNASIQEINALLMQVRGRISEGPAISGLYVIGLESKGDINDALSSLRKSGIVVMAERTY